MQRPSFKNMRLYFINYFKFQGCSGIHIHFLANALQKMGVSCTVCVPDSPESVHAFGPVHYDSITFREFRKRARSGIGEQAGRLTHWWPGPRGKSSGKQPWMSPAGWGFPTLCILRTMKSTYFTASAEFLSMSFGALPGFGGCLLPGRG
jgi:hypothetical protein